MIVDIWFNIFEIKKLLNKNSIVNQSLKVKLSKPKYTNVCVLLNNYSRNFIIYIIYNEFV